MQNVSLWGLICAALQFLKNDVFLIEFGGGNQKNRGGGNEYPCCSLKYNFNFGIKKRWRMLNIFLHTFYTRRWDLIFIREVTQLHSWSVLPTLITFLFSLIPTSDSWKDIYMKVIREHKEQSLNNVYGSFWEECKQRLVLAALRMFTYSAQNLLAHPCLYAYILGG